MAVVCITDDLPEDVDYTKGDHSLRVGVVWLALVRGYPCVDPPPPCFFFSSLPSELLFGPREILEVLSLTRYVFLFLNRIFTESSRKLCQL